MGLKVGDRVKFLNESGGGIVSKILNPKMVNVAVEDGFDIPTMITELVVVEQGGHAENMFREDFKVDLSSNNYAEENQESETHLLKLNQVTDEAEGVYLALVPQDQKWMITGVLDVYIVNHTPFDILYNLMLKDSKGGYIGYDYNSIESESALLINSLEREEMEAWKEGVVQILYHNMKSGSAMMPANAVFRIKSNKLNNENSYHYSALVKQKALVFSLNEMLNQEKFGTEQFKGEDKEPKIVKAAEKKEIPLIDRHQILPRIAEVDLHIAELIDNISGMESRDMFALQKRYFQDCLDSAILHNYKKVTFIHGVGNGILKNAIITILKDYESVETHTASISKFGLGAIDVIIKPWE
ncbi:MAG: hypothetical protein CVU00_04075 [Bacteroidetes bacterium HGW-Bacteroidetes-17]|jgi:hypothetical protein|nr:MAG: hypothetical protein CVU00_04075 [Bacteroidetes bacterium HGW-Bacteroidetes-17]